MSLWSWFSRKPRLSSVPSGLPRAVSAADASRAQAATAATQARADGVRLDPAAVLKVERTERREWVYSVVREAMLHAGVLSASYKFKVLALDERGRRFLIMIDLARELGGDTVQLQRIEEQIAQTAKARYDLDITAVYWRTNDHVMAGRARAQAAAAAGVGVGVAPPAGPAPVADPARAPTMAPARTPAAAPRPAAPVLRAVPSPSAPTAPLARPSGRFEPIQADEVAAFKRALSSAGPAPVAPAPGAVVRSGPRAKVAKGYEDTEMIDPDERPDALSNTQYGDLK